MYQKMPKNTKKVKLKINKYPNIINTGHLHTS